MGYFFDSVRELRTLTSLFRYANMDYLWFTVVIQAIIVGIVFLLTSYDIVCQWSVNLWERAERAPTHLRVDRSKLTKFITAIPNFHIYGHQSSCMRYSLHYQPGVGQTVAEVVESNWSISNPISGSTASMSNGARLDCLDNHFGDANWQKTIHIGALCFIIRVIR